MINNADGGNIIADIIKNNPESDWIEMCEKALPEWSVGEIISIIEIECGGDVYEVEETMKKG